MLERVDKSGKKCGLVVTGSGLGHRPIAGTIVYSAAKGYVNYLTDGLNYEFEGKIDTLHYEAGEVNTKMLKRWTTNWRICSPERAAASSLRDLGIEKHTNGCMRHELFTACFNAWPLRFAQALLYKVSIAVLKRNNEKEA